MKITRAIGFYVIEFGIPLYLYLFIKKEENKIYIEKNSL